MSRRGIALIVVLWVLAAAGTVAGVGMRAVRVSGATAIYRIAHTRARWAADACLELVRARIAESLRRGEAEAWSEPARAAGQVGEPVLAPGVRCRATVEPTHDSAAAQSGSIAAAGWGIVSGYDLLVVREQWGRGLARVAVLSREIL